MRRRRSLGKATHPKPAGGWGVKGAEAAARAAAERSRKDESIPVRFPELRNPHDSRPFQIRARPEKPSLPPISNNPHHRNFFLRKRANANANASNNNDRRSSFRDSSFGGNLNLGAEDDGNLAQFMAVEKKGQNPGRRISLNQVQPKPGGGGGVKVMDKKERTKDNEDIGGVSVNDVTTAAHEIIYALLLRQKYLAASLQSGFFPTTHRYLESTFKNSKLSRDFEVPNMMWLPPHEFRQQEKFHFANVNDPFSFELPSSQGYSFKMVDGVVHAYKDAEFREEVDLEYCDRNEFIKDHQNLVQMSENGICKSFSWRRLKMLESKFNMYSLNNDLKEHNYLREVRYRDFYNVRRVDTHIHAAGCMNQKHFNTFIRTVMKTDGDRVVIQDKEKGPMTFNDILKNANITPDEINVDMLDVHADRSTFQRFDKFNQRYNPLGIAHLRDVFIKSDNNVNGEYFARIVKEVMAGLEGNRYAFNELRISIYGRSYSEWEKLAKWGVEHVMFSTQVRWLIQVPRIADVFIKSKAVASFEQVMYNVFMPLFEATNNPEKHPDIHKFLQYVRAFDSVDDESKPDFELLEPGVPLPQNYNSDHSQNPCYGYYLYYMYANIRALNHLRRARGMNTFNLRPHCGESGATHHLATAFLTSDNISHGLQLKIAPVLQYLYYLSQMGIAMSPLSNNKLFLLYNKSPFPKFYARGLLISLSTDDPLQFHFTKEPLMEEYSVAAQVWKLSTADLCELARNSVYMSSFAHALKKAWLGENYLSKEGKEGNDVQKTNVPDMRIEFRHQTLIEELKTLTDAYVKKNLTL